MVPFGVLTPKVVFWLIFRWAKNAKIDYKTMKNTSC
jgi:hypothetical protein